MRRPREPGALWGLTAGELEVLALMAEGRSNVAIAGTLSMSPKTLEAHVRQILQKLNLHQSPDDHRRVLAVLKYLQAAH
ncbi:response regulator transcription factor [Streptomyces sp. 142MFCol3.1]|uniref:response regulator transcription factor n=1 Tax=Streptomyces sp. 142MFCol3.1 TaxID=1172179 RepID=UPI00099648E6|nr:helix-turn-helix transcriptional regulator [Streptomyces sp. 142MFCol3.1]